jgi:NADP-dependent 3-hydroxy acid dehydrogenase YdfG
MISLKDKAVNATGNSSGIGKSLVKLFSTNIPKVTNVERHKEHLLEALCSLVFKTFRQTGRNCFSCRLPGLGRN